MFVIWSLALLVFLILSIFYPELPCHPAVAWVGGVLCAVPVTIWAIADRRHKQWVRKYLNTAIATANVEGQIWTLRAGLNEMVGS